MHICPPQYPCRNTFGAYDCDCNHIGRYFNFETRRCESKVIGNVIIKKRKRKRREKHIKKKLKNDGLAHEKKGHKMSPHYFVPEPVEVSDVTAMTDLPSWVHRVLAQAQLVATACGFVQLESICFTVQSLPKVKSLSHFFCMIQWVDSSNFSKIERLCTKILYSFSRTKKFGLQRLLELKKTLVQSDREKWRHRNSWRQNHTIPKITMEICGRVFKKRETADSSSRADGQVPFPVFLYFFFKRFQFPFLASLRFWFVSATLTYSWQPTSVACRSAFEVAPLLESSKPRVANRSRRWRTRRRGRRRRRNKGSSCFEREREWEREKNRW